MNRLFAMMFSFCFPAHVSPCRARTARAILWALRLFSPGFVAIEPAIRAELVVLWHEERDGALDRAEGLAPTKDPYGIRVVILCLFVYYVRLAHILFFRRFRFRFR